MLPRISCPTCNVLAHVQKGRTKSGNQGKRKKWVPLKVGHDTSNIFFHPPLARKFIGIRILFGFWIVFESANTIR